MEWQFRKILQSTQNYRSGTSRWMAAIEKNSPGVLKTIVRQIQLIMSDPNANTFSKVLAMRFARDIMILGRQDVINQLTKLVPHMLKVCSYRIESDDQNRGETYFYDHPQYVNATPSEKQVIQSYGSTYFILNLQSIYHWGNWIKFDESGNQSIYSKGLSSLVERGVKFPTTFNYYKNSDTEKFKNTNKVEFFPEESADFDSSMRSSSVQSDRGSHSDNKFKQLNSVEGIVKGLHSIEAQSPRGFLKLEGLKKSAVGLLQKKYNPSMVYYGKEKSEKKWLQNFIVSHNLLTQRKISYEQFIKRANTEVIQIPERVQYQQSPQQLAESNIPFKKSKTSAKRQMLQKAPDQLTRQHETFQQIINKYKGQIKQLNERLEKQKIQSSLQKNNVIQNCEERIRNLKQQIAYNNSGKNQIMIKQNQKLKEKLFDLERSLQLSHSREAQINNTRAAYDMLKVENQNLKKVNKKLDQNISIDEKNQLLQRIKQLQRELNTVKSQNQIILSKIPAQSDLSRKNKQILQLTDEVAIYKNSLQSERNDFDKKYKLLESKYLESEKEIKNLKQKNKVLQKKLDLRDIQAVQLGEQVKLFRALGNQEKFSKSRTNQKEDYSSKKSQTHEKQLQGNPKLTKQKPKLVYNFNKYEDLRNHTFHNEKQRYLRFCRCSLKKKDLLFKQNELEVGLISEPISSNQVKYIVHLTNTSDTQINEINILCEAINQSDVISLETSYIFCLQSNQQEKIAISCKSPSFFFSQSYDPILLTITYIKNSRNFETKLILPFHLFKTLELYKIDRRYETNLHHQYSLTFTYSQKILSEGKYLYSYFPPLEQTGNNKYECDMLWRETGSRFRLEIQLKEEKKITIVLSPLGESRATQKQQQVIEQDLMSFFEFCFRKE